MDPISLSIMAVGLGVSLFGAAGSASASAQAAKVSQDEVQHEQEISNTKQEQMHVEAGRMQLENIRNNQRARAMATNAATQQGAQFGSGLQGGLGQIQDETLFNMQGVNFAQKFSEDIYKQNIAISADKSQIASLGATQAKDQGIQSIGGALMKAGPMVGGLSKGFGGINIGGGLMGGGSPSGY